MRGPLSRVGPLPFWGVRAPTTGRKAKAADHWMALLLSNVPFLSNTASCVFRVKDHHNLQRSHKHYLLGVLAVIKCSIV